MSTILITGGTGFIGSHLVDRLIEDDHDLHVIGQKHHDKHHHVRSGVDYMEMDIRDKALVDYMKKLRPDAVYHLAAQVDVAASMNDPVYDGDVNVLGTIRVLEACRLAGVRKIIFASTAAVYGNPKYLGIDEHHPITPLSAYGLSKYTAEQYIRLYASVYGLTFTILRLANVFGARQAVKSDGAVIATFIDRYLRGLPPVIHGTGQQTRDFLYVADACEVFSRCLTDGDNQVFNVGTGKQTTINELVNLLGGTFERILPPDFGPQRPGDIEHSYYDIQKLRTVLGWAPAYDLTTGLVETVHYYKRTLRM